MPAALRVGTILRAVRLRVHDGTALVLCALGLMLCSCAEGPPAPAAAHRSELALDGTWQLLLDPETRGLDEGWAQELDAGRVPASATTAPLPIAVPGALEGAPQTALHALETATGYDGVAWYARRFVAPDDVEGARISLRFGRVNYACSVWLDGEPVGDHEGGYAPFVLDLTGRLRPGASHGLVVMVVDPGADEVMGWTLRGTPHAKESWYHNWGGLLGPVTLAVAHAVDVESLSVEVRPDGTVTAHYELVAPPGIDPAEVSVGLSLDGVAPGSSIVFQRGAVTDARVSGSLSVGVTDPERWSPENPRLYTLKVLVDGDVVAVRRIGFRTVELHSDGLYLNGVRRPLRGVLYQPHFTGRNGVPPDADVLEDVARSMKETGFNLVRVHVRPAPDAFLEACDRLGLMVLEEPAIGWVDDGPELLQRCRREVGWMVERHRHHPSIVMWGMLNELSGKAYVHAAELVRHAGALDDTRPVLEDSGGFMGGGRVLLPGGVGPVAMVDEHVYPPYPLPLSERERMRALGTGRDEVDRFVFVSEFGYGTVLDAARALAGFEVANLHGEERAFFTAVAQTAERARTRGETWSDGNWIEEAAGVQADAAEDMVEALRSNPVLDGLCYTQWQAVSREPSAGLLAPWGEDRPARFAMRRALRPLMVAVLPRTGSVAAGHAAVCDVAVVNDTGVPVAGRLVVTFSSPDGTTESAFPSEWPAGVTLVTTQTEAEQPGRLEITARLQRGDEVLDESSRRVLRVVGPPDPEGERPRVWVPGSAPAATAFVQRRRLRLVTDPSTEAIDVVLVANPDDLDDLTLDEQLAAWHHVWQGGAAVVLTGDPVASRRQRMLGLRRGVQAVASLPVPVVLRPATGHFLGSFHAVHEEAADRWTPRGMGGGGVRLLGRGDEVLSPVAMLVGEEVEGAATSMITVGFMGERLGRPVVSLPFGQGRVHVVGVPLLDPVTDAEADAVDVRRDAVLAGLVERARKDPVTQRQPWRPLPPEDVDELARDLTRVRRLVELGNRYSPFTGTVARSTGLPEAMTAVLDVRKRALVALMEGRPDEARAVLSDLLDSAWSPDLEAFLEAEEAVLGPLEELVTGDLAGGLDRAHRVHESWARALAAQFDGDTAGARAWLEEAERELAEER